MRDFVARAGGRNVRCSRWCCKVSMTVRDVCQQRVQCMLGAGHVRTQCIALPGVLITSDSRVLAWDKVKQLASHRSPSCVCAGTCRRSAYLQQLTALMKPTLCNCNDHTANENCDGNVS